MLKRQIKYALAITPIIRPEIVNWKRLEQKISNAALRNQHLITGTKFEMAEHLLRTLKSMISTKKITDLIKVSYDEKTNQMKVWDFSYVLPRVLAFLAEYEMFLYTLRSCIDSFLLEVNLIYDLKIPNHKVTIERIKNKMCRQYKDDELTKHLLDLSDPSQAEWFKYLGDLRNFVAHRICSSIITSTDYKLYLPDNSRARSISIEKDFEFFTKLSELLEKTKNFLELGFNYLEKRL